MQEGHFSSSLPSLCISLTHTGHHRVAEKSQQAMAEEEGNKNLLRNDFFFKSNFCLSGKGLIFTYYELLALLSRPRSGNCDFLLHFKAVTRSTSSTKASSAKAAGTKAPSAKSPTSAPTESCEMPDVAGSLLGAVGRLYRHHHGLARAQPVVLRAGGVSRQRGARRLLHGASGGGETATSAVPGLESAPLLFCGNPDRFRE